ncbi:hypothetical protein [Chryseobacterium binzhouense]|uniref:hypothetical protein n=1 Tax=Chryseobacterium binzhouense TaxID=2593646 RepID=UPI0011809A44|nr:hypothetical protein [Chryseobacterium binzhouense]
MIRKLIPFLSLLLLSNCQDGPKAAFNEEFVPILNNKDIPFQKFVGIYELDEDSKKRFGIPIQTSLTLNVKLDKTFTANNYVDAKTWKLKKEMLSSFFYYYSGEDGVSISSPELTDGGVINIYSRKKDSALTLYLYIRPLKGQEHGDYLRYIKVK